MMLVRPDLVRSSSRKFVAIETTSELTRGYSLFDDRPHRNAPNATVIDEIDEGFFRAYVELLQAGGALSAAQARTTPHPACSYERETVRMLR